MLFIDCFYRRTLTPPSACPPKSSRRPSVSQLLNTYTCSNTSVYNSTNGSTSLILFLLFLLFLQRRSSTNRRRARRRTRRASSECYCHTFNCHTPFVYCVLFPSFAPNCGHTPPYHCIFSFISPTFSSPPPNFVLSLYSGSWPSLCCQRTAGSRRATWTWWCSSG